jgi:hypothetical protein
MNDELENLVEKLDSTDRQKAWGEIAVRLIRAYLANTETSNKLIDSLGRSSDDATKINRAVMYLTIVLAISAVVEIVKNIIQLAGK